ncbi:glycosyltransferase family 9 protein [Streptomyces griseomycini]|uniref:ADP-heptose:LPS heptosyltransferase n=1 Tax=Streptomyces griseomycini TaxID=66895 RepID=A0A7W7LZW8_9ACTN|nr:glycosyltransferase family 9 protein [Streptomyces griseomycini]MBB4898801.1 ADP-heptose:LPS heptosyltransferase [Streptomyces griseomycini]GGQ04058.1 glycosyl transferase [Streptomyces griseomycini]GGR18498.1 glycosyl transferase [Streptomyces griseomycini]
MKALVTRLDNFGDVLLAGPAVRAVAARADTVTLLCGPHGAPAARLLPGVDEVLVWDAPWAGFQPPEVRREEIDALVAAVAATDADTALVLTSFHQSPLPAALLLRLAGVRRIAADSEDYPGSLLDVRHHRAPHAHEAEAALDLAEAAGFPRVDDGRLRVLPPPPVDELTGPAGYVVVHPGASVPARAWSPERCAQAVRELAAAGRRVVVTGGARERDLTAYVAGDRGLDLGGRTDAAELAGVLAGAACAVTGNTGPAHLAAAVGTPVVSLFAPVVPAERWRPYGVPYVLLGDQRAPCAGTRARQCPVPGHPCLDDVTALDVVAAVDKLVEVA